MSAEKPCCQSAVKWVACRLNDRGAFAAMTGQDARAFKAFLHLVELYAVSDAAGQRDAMNAMRHVVMAMQRSTRHLAKAAIPHVLDWSDEDRIWHALGVDEPTPAPARRPDVLERG